MRILAVSDLHDNQPWLDFLIRSAGHVDVIAISGDIFEISDPAGTFHQALRFDRAVSEICRKGTSVAFTTGNHDLHLHGALSPHRSDMRRVKEIGCAQNWWEAFHSPENAEAGRVVTPGTTARLISRSGDAVIISAHLYSAAEEMRDEDRTLWKESCQLRRRYLLRPWVALHHVPPTRTVVGERDGNDNGLHEMVDRYRPNIMISGHLHERPFEKNGHWFEEFEGTLCLNPGCSPECIIPNYLLIDTALFRISWRARHDPSGRPTRKDEISSRRP